MAKTLLFNPIGPVHDRNVELFADALTGWGVRCIYNPKSPYFNNKKAYGNDVVFFSKQNVPHKAFEDTRAVVLFSSLPRACSLAIIEEAAFRKIPVIALQEVYQMMLEQGIVNVYQVPVDHIFVGSSYERNKFLEIGMPANTIEETGLSFTYKKLGHVFAEQRDALRSAFGIPKEKRVATLSLAYITPSGETRKIRRELLTLLAEGLPEIYDLVVKPHPAEQDRNVEDFIKTFAPKAKVADKDMPIDRVLGITDILFNRGTSQVVLESLWRQIPVIILPCGRQTLFHGLVDSVIANKPGDVERAIKVVLEKGLDIYKPVFSKYLYITPEEAFRRTVTRIEEIAERREVIDPEERLLELALYWTFAGHPQRGLRIIRKLKVRTALSGSMARLICNKAAREDMCLLKRWACRPYINWILKSLWAKSLYATDKKIAAEDREWFADFPPRMNREYFIPFASMLGWLYVRNGLYQDAEALAGVLKDEYAHIEDIQQLQKALEERRTYVASARYWRMRLQNSVKNFAKKCVYSL